MVYHQAGRRHRAEDIGDRHVKIWHCILSFLILGQVPAGQAQDQFGRFFTTPQQRQHLDELRERQPEDELVVEIREEEMMPEDRPAQKQVPLDMIRLKGLVYRKGGKDSTAWLNDGNTYEGNIGSQYITIDSIKPDSVILGIAGDKSEIRLKAGQAYDPGGKKIHEVLEQ